MTLIHRSAISGKVFLQLRYNRKTMFHRSLIVIALLSASALCQSPKLDSVEISAAQPGDQVTTYGILPNGHIYFRNTTLRTIIAAAYDLDASRVAGGPAWLDSDRFSIEARTSAPSQTQRLAMLQALLAERFKLALHHEKHVRPVYILRVSKDGPKMKPKPASGRGLSDCYVRPVNGQIHLQCRRTAMPDLIEALYRYALYYIDRPIVDLTGLKGSYDLQLDWMGRFMYDAVIAAAATGQPKDPQAVSIFDALVPLGLSLEKQDQPFDSIVIEGAQHIAAGITARKPAMALTAEQISSIDRIVTEEMAREHIPGLAVGIYSRGEILLAKGYGVSNVELGVPVKPETVFDSGSVGKQFVAAAIMMLVEEGKISLDDSVVKYFPNAPASWKPILIKNLLSHTSGLADYATPELTRPSGPFFWRLDFSEDEFVEKLEALPIEFAVGDQWKYSNSNYVLLGFIIHQITGMRHAEFLAQRVFKPWYMISTRGISEKDIIPGRAAGYQWFGATLHNQDWASHTLSSTADGGLYFNVLDLAKWDEALYGTSLLKQSSLDRIWTIFPLNDGKPSPESYGFGWSIERVNGHKVVWHGGGTLGFTCVIERYIDDNLTIVILTNLANGQPGEFSRKIFGILNPALAH